MKSLDKYIIIYIKFQQKGKKKTKPLPKNKNEVKFAKPPLSSKQHDI